MADPTPATKPLRADAQRNRDRLLEAAKATFREGGVDSSLEDVARRAGVGIGTLYRHFPTRDDLLAVLLRNSFDALRSQADELLAEDDPMTALTLYLREMLVHASTFRGVPKSVKSTMHDGETPLGSACAASHAGWGLLFERAQLAGVARTDTKPMDVLRMVYAIAWITDQRRDDPEQVDRMLELVLDGLRPSAAA